MTVGGATLNTHPAVSDDRGRGEQGGGREEGRKGGRRVHPARNQGKEKPEGKGR